MSQPPNSTDAQAVLQSMLQRLKIQTGRDGQVHLHTSSPVTPASPWGQGGERGVFNPHKLNGPVNTFEFGAISIPSKEFRISAADGNFSLKGEETKQPGLNCEVDRGPVSSPTQKGHGGDVTGANRVPGITPTGTGQLFPAKSLKDAYVTSSERTGVKSFGSVKESSNKDFDRSLGQVEDQGFTPRVYTWSLNATNAKADAGSQEHNVFHVENGGFGALAQSNDTQMFSTAQNKTMNRKQQSFENKTRRWTQRIKERWRGRPGSLSKKAEEEQRENQHSEDAAGKQLLTAETLINTSNKEEEQILSSLDCSHVSKAPLTQTEGSAKEMQKRSTRDYEFGLGSFSLLEEIIIGQEWAKFLDPDQSAASAEQSPSEHMKISTNPHVGTQPSLNVNHNTCILRRTVASPVSNFSMAHMSPDALRPVRMDFSEGKHQQYEQSKLMEHGHTLSDVQSVDGGMGQELGPPSFAQPVDILNSSLKSGVHLNRKRQHQSADRRDERLRTEKTRDANQTDGEGSMSSLSPVSSGMMEVAGESQHNSVMPLDTLNSPPLFPSFFTPPAHQARGVLRHSISQDSESSVEIVTKRRRVEENRRVHFSEKVVTIAPVEFDVNATDSEEESMTEHVHQEVQAAIEEVAPARRPALPAWILGLKRKNTRRKHRK